MLLLLLLAASRAAAQQPVPGYAPPQPDTLAVGANLGSAFPAADAAACASACSANASCVAFSLLPPRPLKTCDIVGECYAPNASSCPALLTLSCPGGAFSSVNFASYGTPQCGAGACAYSAGNCSAPSSAAVVAAACVGQSSCAIEVGVGTFGADPCPGVYKFLAVSLAGAGCSAAPPGGQSCQLSQYSRTYTITPNATRKGFGPATYYQRLMPRNDTPYTQRVPYALDVPTRGVTLTGGPLAAAFATGIEYLLKYSVDDLLFNFRKRAGQAQAPGAQCIGWDCRSDWIEGSLAGLFLMGAGGHLRWTEHAVLRSMMDELIDGIENCTEADGYLAAFEQAKLATDEHPVRGPLGELRRAQGQLRAVARARRPSGWAFRAPIFLTRHATPRHATQHTHSPAGLHDLLDCAWLSGGPHCGKPQGPAHDPRAHECIQQSHSYSNLPASRWRQLALAGARGPLAARD